MKCIFTTISGYGGGHFHHPAFYCFCSEAWGGEKVLPHCSSPKALEWCVLMPTKPSSILRAANLQRGLEIFHNNKWSLDGRCQFPWRNGCFGG